MGSVQFMFLRGVLFKAAATEPPVSALGRFVPACATTRQYSAAVSRSTDDQLDDLRKSRGLHSVSAYGHGLYIYIYIYIYI